MVERRGGAGVSVVEPLGGRTAVVGGSAAAARDDGLLAAREGKKVSEAASVKY